MKFPAFSQLAGKIPRVPGSLSVLALGNPVTPLLRAAPETRAGGVAGIGHRPRVSGQAMRPGADRSSRERANAAGWTCRCPIWVILFRRCVRAPTSSAILAAGDRDRRTPEALGQSQKIGRGG